MTGLATGDDLRELARGLGMPFLGIGELVESLYDELRSSPPPAVNTTPATAIGVAVGAPAVPALSFNRGA